MTVSSPPAPSARAVPVAPACSSFFAGFALVHHGDRQFVAFYDPERRITVGSRRLGAAAWTFFRPEGRWFAHRGRPSHQADFDSHNYLALAVDDAGCLHLSGNMHDDPLVYFRSRRPLDASSLKEEPGMTGADEDRATYPLFFRGPRGELLFRYRQGKSGNGVDLYNVYDPAAGAWRRLLDRPLLDGEGCRNAYAPLPAPGPDGRWHLIWMWRESPDCATNNTLSYARSADLALWERADGTPLSLPITRAEGDVVDSSSVGGGLINMSQELGFDRAGRPILTYHRYDAAGRSQAYAARREEGAWAIRPLSAWDFRWDFRGGGSIPCEVSVSRAEPGAPGRLEVAWAAPHGAGVWVLDEETLRVVETRPAAPPLLPPAWSVPRQNLGPGMEVRTAAAQGGPAADGKTHLLRWETLPVNRDRPPEREPAPTGLEVIEIS